MVCFIYIKYYYKKGVEGFESINHQGNLCNYPCFTVTTTLWCDRAPVNCILCVLLLFALFVNRLRAGSVSTSALCHHRKREPQPGGSGPHPARCHRLPHQQALQVRTHSHDTYTHIVAQNEETRLCSPIVSALCVCACVFQVHGAKAGPRVSLFEVKRPCFCCCEPERSSSPALVFIFIFFQYDSLYSV